MPYLTAERAPLSEAGAAYAMARLFRQLTDKGCVLTAGGQQVLEMRVLNAPRPLTGVGPPQYFLHRPTSECPARPTAPSALGTSPGPA